MDLISVIVPTYNLGHYLPDALESIFKQNNNELEVIVVDDGSDDMTSQVVHDFGNKICYVKQANKGAAAARNTGVSLAQGKYLAFLDADDIWLPTKLDKQLEKIVNNDADIVFSLIEQFISPEFQSSSAIKNKILPGYCLSTMLIKTSVFLSIGCFNEETKLGEFIEWYLKAKNMDWKVIVIDEVLAMRRIHTKNTSLVNKKFRSDYLHLLKGFREDKKGSTRFK